MTKDLQTRLKSLPSVIAQLKEEAAPEPKRVTAEERRLALKKAIVELDAEKIERSREVLTKYVDSLVTLDPEATAELTPAQSKALMEEDNLRREIEDLLTARKDTIKSLVFQAIIEEAAQNGAEDPELANGEIVVEELGRRFTREGAGPGKPTIDLKKLKEVLGDDAKKVVKVEIPKPVEVLDEDALNDLLSGNPDLIESVRKALVPGKPKLGSFNNRPVR